MTRRASTREQEPEATAAEVGSGIGGRVAWFHCFSGIAGDMALGSLVDAGADPSELVRLLARLPIDGWSLRFEPVLRNGIAATQAVVKIRDDPVVRTFPHVMGILEEARLPDRARERAAAAFSLLAEVEGRLHRRPISQVHFHELGGHDTIVDIVGTALALELLGVNTVTASPVATGLGMVRSAHGLLPNPGPAVVALLEGIPSHGRDVGVELTTPTGAAMLAAWGSAFGPMPPMTIEATGFGAGSRELDDVPNCTQVVIGLPAQSAGAPAPGQGQQLVQLEANLDDVTGETLAHAVQALLDDGALDAWVTPVLMKKGRPGHVVSVLCDPVLVGDLRHRLEQETGTLGVRAHCVDRWAVPREMLEVEVEGYRVRVKVSPGRIKAEHADAARVAEVTGLPLREVASRAEAAWNEQADTAKPTSPREPGPGPITPMRS
ncbi:MAG: nickel pincer cofactor biosynthesis protein LarC [Acidimicrobiales bacterium]